MALTLENKKAIVADVAAQAKQSISGLVVDYLGLNVGQVTKLREDARTKSVYLRVVRNTLAKKALANTEFECFHDVLSGPTMLAFSQEEPSAPARLFKEYVSSYEHLEVKALAINGKLFEPSELDYIAKLPTRDEAIATLMQVMKAPITKFVRTLAEPHAKLVRTVAAIRVQKEAA